MFQDPRRSSAFMQYALCAAAEALADAQWCPSTEAQRQATGVTIGNGMSSTAEVAEAGQLIVSVCSHSYIHDPCSRNRTRSTNVILSAVWRKLMCDGAYPRTLASLNLIPALWDGGASV